MPISPVQDTAGPMATCVADAAALLSVLAAADPEDPVAPGDKMMPNGSSSPAGPSSFTQALDPAALDGARLGIWRDPSAPAGTATGAVLDMAVAKLRALGAVVVDPVTLPDAAKIPSRSSSRCGTSSSTGSTPTWATSPGSASAARCPAPWPS